MRTVFVITLLFVIMVANILHAQEAQLTRLINQQSQDESFSLEEVLKEQVELDQDIVLKSLTDGVCVG